VQSLGLGLDQNGLVLGNFWSLGLLFTYLVYTMTCSERNEKKTFY